IENVIYLSSPHDQRTWWQSENGVEHVSIRLDLEGKFHFTHLIMKFKTFRPAAMLVERSADFGRTWKVYRYFAYNCSKLFPGVPSHPLGLVDEVLCDQRYSEIEPSSHGEVSGDRVVPSRAKGLDGMGSTIPSCSQVIFKVLDPSIPVADPYSPDIQGMSPGVWGMQGWLPSGQLCCARAFGVLQAVLWGGLWLWWCISEQGEPRQGRIDTGVLPARCGLWCPMPCRGAVPVGCDCNEHSRRCHFDMAVFLATGNTSGAVCDDCQHNTMGRRCHLCKPFYYKDPTKDLRDPAVCRACNCDPEGSLDGGLCDSADDPARGLIAGQCRCKEHVAGPRCDRCKPGFFDLSADNPQGCRRCQCDPRGTVADGSQCDPVSGECFCKRLVTGRSCNQCLPEHWGLSHNLPGCRPCDCDVGGARNNLCAMGTGQCQCRRHVIGRQCEQVETGFYRINLDHYTYEAEDARLHQGSVVEREPPPDRPASWTGTGFAHMLEGGWVEFHVSDVPFSTEYDVVIRYEPQHPEAWQEVGLKVLRPSPVSASSPCGNTIPADDQL
ncbi:LAMB1 protein, partial [Dicaeum eximium]|nr:LAMB1 protein [Dicaeum eximium]